MGRWTNGTSNSGTMRSLLPTYSSTPRATPRRTPGSDSSTEASCALAPAPLPAPAVLLPPPLPVPEPSSRTLRFSDDEPRRAPHEVSFQDSYREADERELSRKDMFLSLGKSYRTRRRTALVGFDEDSVPTELQAVREGASVAEAVQRTALLMGAYAVVAVLLLYPVEGWDAADCAYFAVVTLTTVGYGDLTPSSDVGKAISMMLSLGGTSHVPSNAGSWHVPSNAGAAQRDRPHRTRKSQRG
jgi:hypothetical protein